MTDRPSTDPRPVLVFTQGDPAGIGPEILLKVASEPWLREVCRPLLVLERAAFHSLLDSAMDVAWDTFYFLDNGAGSDPISGLKGIGEGIGILDPLPDSGRLVSPGRPGQADAGGALAALDLAVGLVTEGSGAALITAPLNKAEIAQHVDPDFRGHTDYLAQKAGLSTYGEDYLMAFLAPDLQVALLSTHISLRQAIEHVTQESVLAALRCMGRHCHGRIVVAGLDPHAGEGGLIGTVDDREVRPAVEKARAEGLDVHGPESADSLFSRAIRGSCDWVLALYHDQGLIGVKTAAFGNATNWTLGLPYIRTSVDHGTAYDIAGKDQADASSLRAVVQTTLRLVEQGTLV